MKIVINPKYNELKDFIEKIPVIFDREGEIIYQARNVIKAYQVNDIQICIKSFHIPFFFNRIVYGAFRDSKARRSYEYGLKLLEKRIQTPEPIAYIENKNTGMLYESYYVCINEPSSGMMRELKQGELAGREDLLRSFATFTAHIHKQNVLHRDYSPGNILYKKTATGFSFFIVDINRMEFRTVDMDLGCANLRRLWGNAEMISFIAREYAACRGFDPNTCEQLVLKYHHAFWERYTRRHGGFRPYDP